MITLKKQPCLLCNYDTFYEFPQSVQLKAVSSDCKPWNRGGLIRVCLHCGHIQKRLDSLWQKDVARIYSGYNMYQLSGGREQVVFSGNSSFASPRSLRILERLEQEIGIPVQGYLLDVGCGNGEFLRSFSRRYPLWALAGFEQNDRYNKEIIQIPNVKHFYSGKLDEVDDRFNLITVIHVLGHLPQPFHFLKQLRKKLSEDGLLLVHVPNCQRNPFDLMVLDSCSHFIPARLIQLARDSGFKIIIAATDWVPNYITLILRVSVQKFTDIFPREDVNGIVEIIRRHMDWLERLVNHARQNASTAKFGVFGTAIAGTWLAGLLEQAVHFFVDEDVLRIGKIHLGRKVFHPANVPANSQVYLALPPEIASQIYNRLKKLYPSLKLILPPPINFHKGDLCRG